MQMRIEIFRGKTGLQELAPAWCQLSSQLRVKRHIHCVEWYMALAETLEAHDTDTSLIFIAVFGSNELLAVFPFRSIWIIFNNSRLRALELVSNVWDTRTIRDCILLPSLTETDFLQRFVELIDRYDDSWDLISFRGILRDSFAAAVLKTAPNLQIVKTPGGCQGKVQLISCDDSTRTFERLSRNFRQNLRKSHNHLKSRQVDFVSANKVDELLHLLPELLRVESSGWKGVAGTSILANPSSVSYLKNLIRNFGPRNSCEIHLMQVEKRSIAALFCIVVDNISFLLKLGYDEEFKHIRPGHLLQEHLIKTRGISGKLDFLTLYHAPDWLAVWKPDISMPIYNAYILRPSRKTRAQDNFFQKSHSLPVQACFTYADIPDNVRLISVNLDPGLEYEGIYEDGWVTSQVQLELNSGESKERKLFVQGTVPGGVGLEHQRVVLRSNGRTVAEQVLEPGEFCIETPVVGSRSEFSLDFNMECCLPHGDSRMVSALLNTVLLK